jgi:hypothetical protein
MTNEFNKISTKEETRYVLETATVGGTPSGAVSSIAMPMGGIQRRKGDNLLTPESDTVKQKPRQGPLRTQTGGGKHKDKTKTIPRKAKHKTPVAETKPMSAREKVNKAVDRQRQKDKDARTGLSGMDHNQYQRQLQAKLDKKTAVSESLSPGEYYLWTVKLDDGSTKKMKWSSSYHFPEPEEINQHFEKKYGKKVVDVDFDFAIHGGQQKVTPEPYEPGGSAHSDTSATDRAIGNFDRQVPESVPGGTNTMNFMANAGIPKDEIGYAIMLLRKKQNNKTMNARELADWAVYEKKLRVLLMMRKGQSVAEGDEYNEYSDEVDMVKNNLLTIIRACKELADTLKTGENLPEWVEEKISMSKQNMVTVSEYLQSQHDQGHVYDEDHSTATGGWGQGSMNAAYKSSALAGAGHDDRAMEGYFGRLQERLDAEVDERSVSQAQARTMAAAAHNPAFAKKVGIKTNVAKEFNRADTGKDISKLPKRVIPKKRKK